MFKVQDTHAILHTSYDIDSLYVESPYNVGAPAVFYGINDSNGSLAVLICFNNDVGDYWEWIDEPMYAVRPSAEGLKLALAKYGFDGLIAGIRRDEEATRAKERVFSPRGTEGGWDVRDQPPEFWDQFNASPPPGAHLRIHPILHWTEADIWAYTKRENIPIIPLYLANDGKRYRSLGDADITNPVASTASSIEEILTELDGTKVPERAGRALDHETEDAFERLRVAGYL